MNRFLWPGCLVLFCAGSLAQADPCVGLGKFVAEKRATLKSPQFLERVVKQAEAVAPAVSCTTLTDIVKRYAQGSRKGGRKVEDDKPLDVGAAQAELDRALQDAEVKAQLDALKTAVQDDSVRLLYEAAVLEDGGYYAARELRLQQLKEQLGE